MISPPRDVLLDYLAVGDAQRFGEFARSLHDDVVVHSPGGTTHVGIDAQSAAWRAAHAGLHGLRHDVRQLVADGDLVAARVTVAGRHEGPFLGIEPTGNDLRVDQALFARIRDGRISEIYEVVDTGAGLQQMGAFDGQQLSPG